MDDKSNITGIILAGGKSSRMGNDKAMLTFRGKRLFEYPWELMKKLCNTIIISSNNPGNCFTEAIVVPDNYHGIGPIAGLEACLKCSKTRVNIIIPCDMPFLNEALFRDILKYTENYDAVVPFVDDEKIEPLTGFYSREILPVIVNQIDKGDYKVKKLLDIINTKYVHVKNKCLINNINTPDDMYKFKHTFSNMS